MYKNIAEDNTKNLGEDEVNDIQWFPFIYEASHFNQ